MAPSGKTLLPLISTLVIATWLSPGCKDCNNSADCGPGEICSSSYYCVQQSWEWNTDQIELPSDSDSEPYLDTESDNGDGGVPPEPKEWILIEGGTFSMGSTRRNDEQPVHQVTVPSFYMMRAEVTVAAYAACVQLQQCEQPSTYDGSCTWHKLKESPRQAVNCISWKDADKYCKFKQARLPTEAEWEYAARSQGKVVKYPWGESEPTCSHAIKDDCTVASPYDVCSTVSGNTEQGLCDMAGNAMEWVQDQYHENYIGAPADGSAWLDGTNHVMRGGSYKQKADELTVTHRYYFWSESISVGFRCARDAE